MDPPAADQDAPEKHVQFGEPVCYYYVPPEPNVPSSDFQASRDRMRVEFASLRTTRLRDQLDKAAPVFETCRTRDVTIVYGNLGRNPIVLTYFLDIEFTSEETVGVIAPWFISCQYQVQKPCDLDFLFILEPYFGYHLPKFENVKHVIVLTSHLSLCYPPSSSVLTLFVGKSVKPPSGVAHGPLFLPPIFHHDKIYNLKPGTRLDVREAKSAHEAFLRILTGQELVPEGPYDVLVNPRDQAIFELHLSLTQKAFK